ncbi:DUF4381 domain-containing protein [Ruegeria sp. Alg231-54]|uniref:DUF4381 domain-containing protein n=1 Tax=Ruegeria sp. Alg231-54 TaxID=1922221 RepID=UPI000D552FF1|nr:DUF4381 domain-containing protein [Ruegeria sp. Alg231-54]
MSVDVEGKSLVDLLDMLEPAPVPEPISMIPQTWGWGVLALILADLIILAVYAFLRHRQTNAYRREALVELAASDNDAAKIAEILRRTALVAYPRREVAALHGEDWTNFLNQTSDNVSFTDGRSRQLLEAPYRDVKAGPDLKNLARNWIKSHKRERTA